MTRISASIIQRSEIFLSGVDANVYEKDQSTLVLDPNVTFFDQ